MAAPDAPERPRMGLAGKVVLVALAVFGTIALVDWVLGWLFGLLKFALLVVVIVAVVAAVASLRRD